MEEDCDRARSGGPEDSLIQGRNARQVGAVEVFHVALVPPPDAASIEGRV